MSNSKLFAPWPVFSSADRKMLRNRHKPLQTVVVHSNSKLILTHQVTETFPQNIEEFKRESCTGGWNWFIKKSLKEYLEK